MVRLWSYRPQTRIGPQSMWTKLAREYLPTPPAEHEIAAREICDTLRPEIRISAAWPFMCSEFRATERDRERSMALVLGER